MAKVTITEEGMIRTGEYVNKLRKPQQDGLIGNMSPPAREEWI